MARFKSDGSVYLDDNENLYLKTPGDVGVDGDRRLTIDEETSFITVQRHIDNVWRPTSFETGPDSLWVGKTVGVAGLGHHLATQSVDGHLHFHAHSEFDGELTTGDVGVIYADFYTGYMPVQPDQSGEFTGKVFEYQHLTTSHALLKTFYIKTGNTPAGDNIRFQVWQGTSSSGTITFDQKYPVNLFTADTEVPLQLAGKMEYMDNTNYFFRLSSDGDFSLRTNASGTQWTLAIAFSRVREDNLLQTQPWVDGDTYTDGQYFIDNRQIYMCNVSGTQTGTFEENSDKWDLISDVYQEALLDSNAIAYADSGGKIVGDITNFYYDPGIEFYVGVAGVFDGNLTAEKIYFKDSDSDYMDYDTVDDIFRFSSGLWVSGELWAGELTADHITIGTADISDYVETPIIRSADTDTVTIQDKLKVTDTIIVDDTAIDFWDDAEQMLARLRLDGTGYFEITDELDNYVVRMDVGARVIWLNAEVFVADNLFVDVDSGIWWNPAGSDRDCALLSVDVAGEPAMIWDESEDAFSFNKEVQAPTMRVQGLFITSSGNSTEWDDAYGWGDHSTEGYLTSISGLEEDPVFLASPASGIEAQDITNWDEAYSWGDHSDESYLTSISGLEEDPIFTAWDKSTGISITESQISDLDHFTTGDETDPVFTAWDKSAGISITESQISDLDHFTTNDETDPIFLASPASGIAAQDITNWDEAYSWGDHSAEDYLTSISGLEEDPIFTAWDKDVADLTGIDANKIAMGKDGGGLRGTGNLTWDGGTLLAVGVMAADGVDTPEIANTSGLLKIQPDANEDVELFGDADVGDGEDGREIRIHRKAAEGDEWMRMYITSAQTAMVHGSANFVFQGQTTFTINSVTKDVILKVGDSAGAKKLYFKNKDGNTQFNCDSIGKAFIRTDLWFNDILGDKISLYADRKDADNMYGFGVEEDSCLYAKSYHRYRWYIGTNADLGVSSFMELTNIGLDVSGDITVSGTVDGVDIAALDVDVADLETLVDTKAPFEEPTLEGGVYIKNALTFHDSSMQYEAAERNFSLGHVHTAVPSGFYDNSAQNAAERGVTFNPAGTKMYIVGLANGGAGDGTVWEYTLSIPWDLTTVGSPTSKSVETYSENPTGICFSPNGRIMYLCDASESIVSRWTSILAWNLATFNYIEELDTSSQETQPQGVDISPDGKRLYVIGTQGDDVNQYSLNTAWDLSDVIPTAPFGTSIDDPTCVRFSSDGRRMYVMDGSAEDDIHEYHLDTPWSVGTATLKNLYDVSAQNASPQGIYIKHDNSAIYMVGTSTPEGVYEYKLGLEVDGAIISNNGPMRAGSMTTTQRDAWPAVNGDIIYNTTTNVFNFFENNSWTTK